MRPHELDYTRTDEHYFDIENGEVLVGEDEHQAYLEFDIEDGRVKHLGQLLRSSVDLSGSFEAIDASEWNREDYIQYGRWLRNIIEPPRSGTRWITREILLRGEMLGVGPAEQAIQQEFKSPTNYFAALKLGREDVTVRGAFEEWTLEDFIKYLRDVGGDKPPTIPQITEIARRDTSKPSIRLMERKYPQIKFRGLLKLAGYTGGLAVIRSWDEDDYIDWGVRFMEDNDGRLPTAVPAEYFSKQKLGPSTNAISNKFGSLPDFEKSVAVAYWDKQALRKSEQQQKYAALLNGIVSGKMPEELFADLGPPEAITARVEKMISAPDNKDDQGNQKIFLNRYGRYAVMDELNPSADKSIKTLIAIEADNWKSFSAAVKKHFRVQDYDIEYAATVTNFLDDLWQIESMLPSLELGDDYRAYVKQRDARKVQRRKEARLRKQSNKTHVSVS